VAQPQPCHVWSWHAPDRRHRRVGHSRIAHV